MVPGSLLLQINALQNSFHHYLLLVLKPYLPVLIINSILMVFITILEFIVLKQSLLCVTLLNEAFLEKSAKFKTIAVLL